MEVLSKCVVYLGKAVEGISIPKIPKVFNTVDNNVFKTSDNQNFIVRN